MGFIQLIEFRSNDIDQLKAFGDEFERTTEGKRTVQRAIICQDRNDLGRFFNIVFFDSYEAAMENSRLPETQAIAEKMAAALGEATFSDLDIIEDRG
jgi:hypothetical protein